MRRRFFRFAGVGGAEPCLGRMWKGLGVGPAMFQVLVEQGSATYFKSGLLSINRPNMGLMNLGGHILNLQIPGLE